MYVKAYRGFESHPLRQSYAAFGILTGLVRFSPPNRHFLDQNRTRRTGHSDAHRRKQPLFSVGHVRGSLLVVQHVRPHELLDCALDEERRTVAVSHSQ